MASAGRILIIPKGDYNENSTYDNLDLVKYKGTSWLAKKTVTGIEPSEANSEYWQDMFSFDYSTAEASEYLNGFTSFGQGVNLFKIGRMAIAKVEINTQGATLTAYTEIAKIPAEFSPVIAVAGAVMLSDGSFKMVAIENDCIRIGDVTFPSDVIWALGTIVYFTAS